MVLCIAATSLAADPPAKTEPRSFTIPQHGKLILNLPADWKREVREPSEDAPPTIVLSQRESDDFQVLITPLWSPTNNPSFNTPKEVKRLMEGDLKEMLTTAVEKKVKLLEFKAREGTGYHFLVTDKAPKPGEYPHAVRAGVGVGDLLLSVTILCRSKDSPAITSTIAALAEAEQKKD